LERNFSLAIRLAGRQELFTIELGVFPFSDIDVSGRAKPHRQAQRLFIVHLQPFAFMDGNPK
jgi:hypothetical protein